MTGLRLQTDLVWQKPKGAKRVAGQVSRQISIAPARGTDLEPMSKVVFLAAVPG